MSQNSRNGVILLMYFRKKKGLRTPWNYLVRGINVVSEERFDVFNSPNRIDPPRALYYV